MSTVCRCETQSLFSTLALGTETTFASGRVPPSGSCAFRIAGGASTTSFLDSVVASAHLYRLLGSLRAFRYYSLFPATYFGFYSRLCGVLRQSILDL